MTRYTGTVRLAACLAAVFEIARAGVLRDALRWAPLWGLVALAAPQLIAAIAFAVPQ